MKRTLTLALGFGVALLGTSLNAAEITVTTEKGTKTYWTGFGPSGQLTKTDASSPAEGRVTFQTGDPNATVQLASGQMQAKNLLGARVNDMQGKKVGQIEDIVIDPSRSGQFAVVKLSGDLGASVRHYTPIPLSALRPTSDKGVYELTVDHNKLQSASRFNVERWPTASVTWGPEIYTHYGLTYDAAGAPGANVVVQTGYESREELPFDYWEKSVDNGTAPDGKTTFPFLHDATDRRRASWR